MKINVATWFTILRLILVPIIIIVILSDRSTTRISIFNQFIDFKYFVAGLIFIIGSLTDFIDGFLARKLGQVTDLGKFLDPIADKLFVNSTVIVLIGQGMISPLFGIIFIGRDTIVDVIRMIASNKGFVVAASKFGKLKTVFQMMAITMILFFNIPFEAYGIQVSTFLMYIAVFFSVYSGVDYYYLNKKFIFSEINKEIEE